MAEKVTGPKSYSPSIEKKYGPSIAHWMRALVMVYRAEHQS